MVVNFDSIRMANGHKASTASSRAERAEQSITIGLLNNMAGAAFKATERQFVSLLESASEGIGVHVSFYTLPGLSLAESGGHHFASHYQSVEKLLDTRLDGLMVTGREPKMADLRDEPYWESFTQVADWARDNTHSTVWSCLAAHAAILHMDGIRRRRNEEKNFGVFECVRVIEHPLMEGVPAHFHVPHSRWNGVAESDLTAHGYRVLSRMVGNTVDTFVKQEGSLFVFLQGHLEYESDTLMREYRRDVGRYVKGEADAYPLLPRGYFDRATEAALELLREKAASRRGMALLNSAAAVMESAQVENTWQRSASLIIRNWLQYICAQKSGSTEQPIEAVSLSV
jgi:homoserine O-succinyltransferase/O-acetyltransferase